MAMPAPRDLPTVDARWDTLRRCYIVVLPSGAVVHGRDESEVEELVARHASGAAVRFYNPAQRQQQEGSALVPLPAASGGQGPGD